MGEKKKKNERENEMSKNEEEDEEKEGKEKAKKLPLTLASLVSLACIASSSESGARCRSEESQAPASKGRACSPPVLPSRSRSEEEALTAAAGIDGRAVVAPPCPLPPPRGVLRPALAAEARASPSPPPGLGA